MEEALKLESGYKVEGFQQNDRKNLDCLRLLVEIGTLKVLVVRAQKEVGSTVKKPILF